MMLSIGIIRRTAVVGLITATLLVPSSPAEGQATQTIVARTYPSVPGAVAQPPAWLVADKEIPFDLKAFFALPRAEQNAAPLYLDALFEFSPDVRDCFPKGSATDARAQKASDRSQRVQPLLRGLGPDNSKLDRNAIRAIWPEFQEGFRKLAETQARPRCVFTQGIDLTSLLPHVQACRQRSRGISQPRRGHRRGSP
jgi:hypothetical protein